MIPHARCLSAAPAACSPMPAGPPSPQALRPGVFLIEEDPGLGRVTHTAPVEVTHG